jgi:hypothetical protein
VQPPVPRRARRSLAWIVAAVLGASALTAGSLASGASASVDSTGQGSLGTLGVVAFFNLRDGYGVFDQDGSTTCTDRIGETDDGGARFGSLVRVDRWPCVQNGPADQLAFDDHGDGFFYGPKLFVTHDGGASWSADPQHGAVLSVEALGFSIWMLETARQPPPFTSKDHAMGLRLFESVDGGLTWTDVALPGAAVIQAQDDWDGAFTGWLTRTSVTSAYVAAEGAYHGGHGPAVTPMWFTDDGGATWTGATIPCGSFTGSLIMSVAPQGNAFDVCESEPGAGMQLKQVLESSDDGAHWTWRLRCNVAQDRPCTSGSDVEGYVSEIDAVSASTIYQVGGRSDLVVTHDGGRTWLDVPAIDTAAGGGTSQVIFFSTRDGMVLGQGYRDPDFLPEIWETTDGGAHWTTRFPTAT